jgi:predicted homoserine dehydrogenase-like protein
MQKVIFAQGARLLKNVAKDQPIHLSDVSLATGGGLYNLYQQQEQFFPPDA